MFCTTYTNSPEKNHLLSQRVSFMYKFEKQREIEVRYLSPVVGFIACDLVGVEVRLFGLDDASILCKRVCSSRTCEGHSVYFISKVNLSLRCSTYQKLCILSTITTLHYFLISRQMYTTHIVYLPLQPVPFFSDATCLSSQFVQFSFLSPNL